MGITTDTKNIKSKIDQGNPWYVAPQAELYEKKQYKRVIDERLKFIKNEIISFKNKTGRRIKILDAGCGDGFYLNKLRQIEDVEIFGLDYSMLRISRAKNANSSPVLVNGGLHPVAFKDSSFDIILLNHVLEHIKDDTGVLREVHRVLKSGGMIILSTPNEGCLLAKMRNNIFQRSILKETDHVNFYTENKLKIKLGFTGFKIIKTRRESFFCPLVQINEFLSSYEYGFKLLYFLGNVFKSQCGGLQFVCNKI